MQPDGLYFLFQQISLCAAPEKQIKYNSLEIIEERSCDSLLEYSIKEFNEVGMVHSDLTEASILLYLSNYEWHKLHEKIQYIDFFEQHSCDSDFK